MTEIPNKARFTVTEVALYWSVSRRSVYFWIERRKILHERTPGGAIRIPRECVVSGPPDHPAESVL
jgi:excisionase family DNA binding protein